MRRRQIGSLLEIGPDAPTWTVKNRMKSDALQAERVASARGIIRDEHVASRTRPVAGTGVASLTKAEESWLADWVEQECAALLHRAEADLAPAAKKLKLVEERLGDLFAFVLDGSNYRRAEKLIQKTREKFMMIIARRRDESADEEARKHPVKKKKGRKKKYDAAADMRLLKQLQTSGVTEKEFLRERGGDRKKLHAALQRARVRLINRKNAAD